LKEYHLEERASYEGWMTSEKRQTVFSNTLINVLPSYNEGLPMTILESMGYGIPNISTNIAAIPEAITDGVNGFTIEPGDVDSLAEKMKNLILHKDLWVKFSNNAYETAKNEFSIKTHFAQLMKIYEGYDNYSSDGYLKLFAMPLYGILDLNVLSGRYDKAYIPFYGDASLDSTTESNTTTSSSTKEHSTTNLQVENVDEADITKTAGDYIYSISENKVIITNVQDPTNIKIEKEIYTNTDYVPEDLMLYKEKLIVISTQYLNHAKSNTMVTVYDITTKSNPKLVKEYTLL